MELVHASLKGTAVLNEVLDVAIMLVLIIFGTLKWLFQPRHRIVSGYYDYRIALSKSLLIGLSLLVAGDVIHTVAITPTMESVATLGLLVIVRTFLGWTLQVEID